MPVIPSVEEVDERFERLSSVVRDDDSARADLAAIVDLVTTLCLGIVVVERLRASVELWKAYADHRDGCRHCKVSSWTAAGQWQQQFHPCNDGQQLRDAAVSLDG